jgi:hypothetical protein
MLSVSCKRGTQRNKTIHPIKYFKKFHNEEKNTQKESMMNATQYSKPLLDSNKFEYDAELTSMMKMYDTSSNHYEYETGSRQGSFHRHEVISTAVTVEESSKVELEYAIQKILTDGIATSAFYAGVLFSSITFLAGFTVEALFLSYSNEIRRHFQTTWVSVMIFSTLWTMMLVIIVNTARVLILYIAHASRSSKNEVEWKSMTQFLNYSFIAGGLTGGSAAWVCIDLVMGLYWMALGTLVFPIGLLVRNRFIHQNIMKGGDAMLMQLDDL